MTGISRRAAALAAFCLSWLTLSNVASAAETLDFRISKQPSILYLQHALMEENKLIEKHAAAMGLPGLNVRWLLLTSGGVNVDSLLAGQLDVVSSGMSNMLLAWGKTNGAVKAISAIAGLPMFLITRNPSVKTLADFGPADRIAVPTLKVSMQATILGIALEKLYGPGGNTKLDTIQVQLGHPDAAIAVLNPMSEINTHFAPPPYASMEMKAPNAHSVLSSVDVLGGPAHITASFSAQKFVDENPIKIKAFIAALDEASDIIAKDPKAAAEAYLRTTKEKISVDDLAELIKTDGAIFSATPQRSMIYADFMHRAGIIKKQAKSWKDYFIAALHDRQGS